MRVEFTAGADDHDRRLETVVRRLCPHLGLGGIHKALRKGDIRLNGAKAAPEARISSGDVIAVWDALVNSAPDTAEKAPPLPAEWILFDGQDLLVVNKPSGILVHRGEGAGVEPPLDERVRAWLVPQQSASLGFRPGPLHRLDRETSGIVVFSRSLIGARSFSDALASRRVRKIYLAVLTGVLKQEREVSEPVSRDSESRTSLITAEGDTALTRFRPLASSEGMTLAEVDLGTGRTHQIRVHAQSLGHPLIGDLKYGAPPSPQGLDVPWLLHAWKLSCDLLPPLKAPLPAARAAWITKTFKISL